MSPAKKITAIGSSYVGLLQMIAVCTPSDDGSSTDLK